MIPVNVGPLLVFVIYIIQATVKGTNTISTNQAFTSFAIISLLTDPAKELLTTLPILAAAMGCLSRIQTFLLSQSCEGIESSIEIPLDSINTDIEMNLLHSFSTSSSETAVAVDKASIRPAPGSKIALHDISFQIVKGSFAMIIGTVGSGKSTLLKAILGELSCTTGLVRVSSKSISYCSQAAWLQNATIRQNICGTVEGPDFDSEWYNTVLHACALNEDLSSLPNGDNTLIGSRGIILSGGQKQRLVS